MESDITSEICKKCAECCKNFSFVELTRTETDAIAKLTGLALDVFADQKSEAVEEYFLQFKDNGYCFFLNEKNGEFSCDVYDARSKVCRNYPSKPIQLEVCDANRRMTLGKISG